MKNDKTKKNKNIPYKEIFYILIINCCLFLAVMAYDYYHYYDLSNNAEFTVGYVTNPVSDYINYKYKVNGNWLYGSQACYEKNRFNIKVGDSYLVLYSSVNHENNKLLYKKVDSLVIREIKLDSIDVVFFEKPKGLIPWLFEEYL